MIKDLAELKKLLQLCRKQGVTDIELEGLKIKLGEMPVNLRSQQDPASDADMDVDDPYSNFPNGILSPSQLAFYSSGGVPDEDPELKYNK